MNQTSELRKLITGLYFDCLRQGGTFNETETEPLESSDQLFCPRTFDGYLCWPKTRAGAHISQQCPPFVTGFDSNRVAYKECLANGRWFAHPESGAAWSNYTTCIDFEDLSFRRSVNHLYMIGYSVSLGTLLLSLALLIGFKTLRCTRIRIHIQLFTSLALGCLSWILWYKLIVENPPFVAEHQVICIVLHLIIHYLMLTNYFWMFCEGLHLWLVLVVVFLRDNIVIRSFYIVGWILPLSFIIIYAITRLHTSTINSHCWMEDDDSMWVLTAPVSLSLITSLGFLVYVVRVLVTKLSSSSGHQPPLAFRKAVRATFILFPLFGLQHILLPLRPDPGTFLEKNYQIFSAIVISCQGLCVSCLFCFANHEVAACVKSLLHRFFPRLISATTWESGNGPPPTQSRDVVV